METTCRTVATTEPFNATVLFTYLRRWAVPGCEVVDETSDGPRYARAIRLPHGPAQVRLQMVAGRLEAEILADPADVDDVVLRVARLCDAAADSASIDARLGDDPHLGPLVAACPGLRIPGTTDPRELAFQALVGQQISMAAAAVCAAKLTRSYGTEVTHPGFGVGWLFPTPEALARVDPTELPMPRARGRALVALARALDEGTLVLDRSRPWALVRRDLLAQPGIGPWTADYIGLRALGQTDILLGTDLVIAREIRSRGVAEPESWSPWRSYATLHLWRAYV